MKYKNNLTLTNPRRVPFSLSNQFDDTFGLTDMVSDCKNAEDFCAAANKYDRFHLKWKIDKDSKNETRLTCKDTLRKSFGALLVMIKSELDRASKQQEDVQRRIRIYLHYLCGT